MSGAEGVAMLTWIMPAMLGSSLTNAIITQHGSKASIWWWKNIYLANKHLFTLRETPMEYFMYFVVNLAIKTEGLVKKKLISDPSESRAIQLDSTMMYLLSKAMCPLRNHFFDQKTGKCIRRSICLPSEPFFIDSVKGTSGGKQFWTWLKVYPLSDGVHLMGFEIWTYQWFWGWQSNSPYPSMAKKLMITTVDDMKKYSGMDTLVRFSAIAHNKLPALSDRDKLGAKDYLEFAAGLMDPDYAADKDSMADILKTV